MGPAIISTEELRARRGTLSFMVARIIAVLAVLAALATAAWFLWPRDAPPPPSPVAAAPEAAPKAEGPRHPIAPPAGEPLPGLKQSDPAIRESYATRMNPVKPIGGPLATTGSEATLAIGPANARRYSAFVAMVEKVDAADAVAAYRRLYPLFQQAYVDLGYPNGYFNDRLVDVIDHLLATPDLEGPIALAQPHVLYEFADPALEERSSGQKAMLRMGRDNAARLKAKLRELRSALVL
jgi:hypothetical protein